MIGSRDWWVEAHPALILVGTAHSTYLSPMGVALGESAGLTPR